MFMRDTSITAKFFRSSNKRETGTDCIRFLKVLLATKSAPRKK